MLLDETCFFLAVDFDGDAWMDDATVFRQTCRNPNLPVALERSRSGNGGHFWFFFEEAIPAALPRKLGATVLPAAMECRPEIGLQSYDRLLPNQDTLPNGGFGNLIALPLQREARRRGNSVFGDESFAPFPDPWEFLSQTPRLAYSLVLVHRHPWLEQRVERLAMFLDVPPRSIGRLGGGRKRLNGKLDAVARLAIEVDGVQHLSDPAGGRPDRRKAALLQEDGYLVLRLLAPDVSRELDATLNAILRAVAHRNHAGSSSSHGTHGRRPNLASRLRQRGHRGSGSRNHRAPMNRRTVLRCSIPDRLRGLEPLHPIPGTVASVLSRQRPSGLPSIPEHRI